MNITNIFLAIMLVTFIAGYDIAHTVKPVEAQEPVETSVPSPTALPTPLPIPDDIVGYINYKFGEDAFKAFKVLQGEGCGENRHLNPEAINDNTKWGGIGQDRGYWQINNIFHPHVSDACAKDVKCSTDYAYRMFVNDDKTFSRWTCGKYYGI